MSDANKVIVMGNLTHDPRHSLDKNGHDVCTIKMANNRTWKNKFDEVIDEPTFLSVQVFGKNAKCCADRLRVGSKVFVEARLHNRLIYVADEEIQMVELICEKIYFL